MATGLKNVRHGAKYGYDRSSDSNHPYKKPGPGKYGVDVLTQSLLTGWDPSRQFQSDFMHHLGVSQPQTNDVLHITFSNLGAECCETLVEALDCESGGSGLVFDNEARACEKTLNRLNVI